MPRTDLNLRERMDVRGGGASSAVPPRTLNVLQFAAARSSEVQALYDAVQAQAVNSGARQLSLTTPRHLRRRTASHNRRLPFRWKHNATQSRKRKASVEQLQTGSAVGQSNAAPASKEESSQKPNPEERTLSRRVRRRIELQGVRNGTRSCMRDGTRRLATHVWHAKRFPMTKLWGYCLPQGLPGRGRGSQAVFKWVKDAAVLHDASYIGLIELQGTADAILQTLCRVLEPPPCSPISGSGLEEEMHGLLYGNAVLHNAGKVTDQAIAPVTILWRPPSGEDTGAIREGAVEERQLWVWVHPSAFDNGLKAISTACQRQGQDNPQAPVKCQSRRGELARLDLLGSRALQVLQKVLRPVPREYPSGEEAAECSEHQDADGSFKIPIVPEVIESLSATVFSKANCLPMGAVLALDVYDPRDTPPSFYAVNDISFLETAQDDVINTKVSSNIQSTIHHSMDKESAVEEGESIMDKEEDIGVTCLGTIVEKGLTREVSDSPYLWLPRADQTVAAATSQKTLSEKRHKRRNAFFRDIDGDVFSNGCEAGPLDSMIKKRRACPVLLLKQKHLWPSASGWSIIMPITWVQAFWVPLIFAGGHVIGLREHHWLATHAGIPYFPHDFPDCSAHAQHLAVETAAFESKNKRRPPSKRVPCFTVSPLQRSVMNAYKGCLSDGGGSSSGELIVQEHREQCTEEKHTMALSIPERKNLDDDTTMTDTGTSVARVKNLDGDTAMTQTGTLVTRSPFSAVLQQTDDGVNVSHLTKLHGDNRTREIDSHLDMVLSTLLSSQVVSGEDAPEATNVNEDIAMTETDDIVVGPPFAEVACQTADIASVPQFTKPHVGGRTIEDNYQLGGMLSSPVGPLTGERAVSPEMKNPESEDVPTGTGAIVARPPLLQEAGQTIDEVNVTQFTKSLSDNAPIEADCQLEGIPSSPVASHTVSEAVIPAMINLECDITITETNITVAGPPFSQVASRAFDRMNVGQFVKTLSGDATTKAKFQLGGILSSPVASDRVDGAVGPEMTNPEGDSARIQTGIIAGGLPFAQLACQTANMASGPQFTKPVGNNATDEANLSSSVASQLQQVVSDAFESDEDDAGSCPSGAKTSTAKETSIKGTNLHNSVVLEVGNNLTKTLEGNELPLPVPPSSPGHRSCLVPHSSDARKQALGFFVARTIDALMQGLRDNGLQHALVLQPCLIHKGGVQNGLRLGRLEWRPSHASVELGVSTGNDKIPAAVGRQKKSCHVRVLIAVPHKGVIRDCGLLCSPTKEDFTTFLSRSQHWQGVATSWLNQPAKKPRKNKVKGKKNWATAKSLAVQTSGEVECFTEGMIDLDNQGHEESSNRETIGCITSTGPRGSLWSGTGICEVGSLIKLRAMQWTDQRWFNNREILLLAGNKSSPMLRPVLVSIALEIGQQDVM